MCVPDKSKVRIFNHIHLDIQPDTSATCSMLGSTFCVSLISHKLARKLQKYFGTSPISYTLNSVPTNRRIVLAAASSDFLFDSYICLLA